MLSESHLKQKVLEIQSRILNTVFLESLFAMCVYGKVLIRGFLMYETENEKSDDNHFIIIHFSDSPCYYKYFDKSTRHKRLRQSHIDVNGKGIQV